MSRYTLLLQQIDAFCERTGITPTAIGKAVCNDPNIIHQIRRGRRPNLDTVEKIQEYMIKNDPRLFVGEMP